MFKMIHLKLLQTIFIKIVNHYSLKCEFDMLNNSKERCFFLNFAKNVKFSYFAHFGQDHNALIKATSERPLTIPVAF